MKQGSWRTPIGAGKLLLASSASVAVRGHLKLGLKVHWEQAELEDAASRL